MQVNLDNLLCLWNSILIQEVAIALNGMMTRERDLLIFMCTKTEPSRTIGTKKARDFFCSNENFSNDYATQKKNVTR